MENMIFYRRWYDHIPDFGPYIDRISELDNEDREDVILAIKDMILQYDPSLMDRYVYNFAINRRWYDNDPFSWLVINTLKYCDQPLKSKVTRFLSGRLPNKKLPV